MVRIISIRYEDGYIRSTLFPSVNIEEIVSKFLSFKEDFDETRVIFPDLSERVWKDESDDWCDEEEE